MRKRFIMIDNLITVMDNDIQHRNALKVLAKAKQLESQKKGYKFVRIDERTKVYRKL